MNIIDSSFAYNSQNTWNFDEYCYDDVEYLKLQADELEKIKEELEKKNLDLKIECENLDNQLKQQVSARKESDVSLAALNQYMEGLDKAILKTSTELNSLRRKNEELMKVSGSKAAKIDQISEKIEKPTPKPINYKPLSQRSLRNSKDSSFNNLIKH